MSAESGDYLSFKLFIEFFVFCFLLIVLIFRLIIYKSSGRGKGTLQWRVPIVSNLGELLLNVGCLIN